MMIEFSGWKHPQNMDVMVCAGTWSSLVRYPSGNVMLVFWQVFTHVSRIEFRKSLDIGKEVARRLLSAKLRQAIDEAERIIVQTNKTHYIVVRKKNGRKYAKRIEHISWMHNRELEHLSLKEYSGRPARPAGQSWQSGLARLA